MFGALFTAYTVYRASHPQAFHTGSADMNILLGSINTALLLTSSLMLAFAEHSAQVGNRRLLAIFLILTMTIGLVFLGIKFTEYYQHFQEHKAPGVWFKDSSPYASSIQMFFVFYFIMTGLHAIHMIIGIGILAGVVVSHLYGHDLPPSITRRLCSAASTGILSISFGSFSTQSFTFRGCIYERAGAFA